MQVKIKYFLMLVLALLISVPISAEEPKQKPQTAPKNLQEKVLKNFIAWDKKLNTLDTLYTQETSFEGTLISKSLGHLFKSANNLRLETLDNDNNLTQYALTDKKIIRVFDEKGSLIMETDWESWRDNQQNKSLFDFNNYANILKKHDVRAFETTKNNYVLTLAPKEGDEYILTFLLNKGNYFPTEINLENEGVKSKTTLQNIKINTAVSKEIFK